MTRLLLSLALLALLSLVLARKSVDQSRRRKDKGSSEEDENTGVMRLEVLDHQPCGIGKYPGGEEQEMIQLPSRRIRPNKRKPGCYKLSGRMDVKKRVKNGIANMHLEIKNKPDPQDLHDSEPCNEPNPDGCEGIGSCLYCKPCEIDFDEGATTRYKKSCERELRKNMRRRMTFEFCLPSRKTFFESKGFSEDVWQKVNGKNGRILNKVGVFMTLRFYDKDIRENMVAHRRWEQISRSKLRIPEGDPLPKFERDKLPFNKYKNDHMIGCHIIVGNLFLEDSKK